MPEMSGKELYTRALENYPDLKVLYMSGYTEDVIDHHGILNEGINFIQKPFSILKLATRVREILDQ
jgi:DNA-binding response OmpR family regulator